MMSQLEFLPNELFLHGIFPYLSLIDLNYAFPMLNQRFNKLVSTFLDKKVHYIHLTSGLTCHQMIFLLDYILPYLSDNHQLKSLELCHADLFIKFLNNIHQINTIYLNKIIVTSFVDIHFESIIQLVSKSLQLNEIKLKVLTNVDTSWANGRKWSRWFDKMLENKRENILKTLDICVWCLDTTNVIKFDSQLWNREGIYRNNRNWKVQLKPDQDINRQRSRQTVEFSRCDQDYLALSFEKEKSSCILS